jgi:hypothetical protein
MTSKRKTNNSANESSHMSQQPKVAYSQDLNCEAYTRRWERSEYYDNDKYDEWYHDADPDDENYYYLFDF